VVSAEVRPTEDPDKVEEAIKNVFSPSDVRLIYQKKSKLMIAVGTSYDSLERLRELLRRERILDAAHRILRASIRGENKLVFHLNKQAAYAGHLSFSDPGESPMGPITFEIECDDIRGMIDWLAPKTFSGIVREHGKPRC